MTRHFLLLLAIVFFLASGVASANQALLEREQARVEETTRALADINDAIESGSFSDVRTAEKELRRMLSESRSRQAILRDELRRANERLDLLPPAPAEGVNEPASIARARESAQSEVDRVAAFVASIEANIETERRLLAALSTERVKLLYRDLLERRTALYSPVVWRDAANAAGVLANRTVTYFNKWIKARSAAGVMLRDLALLVGAFGLSIAMIGPVHRWLRRTFVTRLRHGAPTWARRVAVAGVIMLARLIPGLVGGLLVFQATRLTGLLQPGGEAIAFAIWFALAAFLLVEGFTSGLFSAGEAGWGLAAQGVRRGRRVSALLLAIVGVVGLKSIVEAAARTAEIDGGFAYLVVGVAAVVVGGLVILLCRRLLWVVERSQHNAAPVEKALLADGEKIHADTPPQARGFFFRRTGRVVAVAVIVSAIVGYVPFADFIAMRIYYAALILAVAWILRETIRELILYVLRRLSTVSLREDDGKNVTRFWVGALVDVAFLIALAPAVLVLIGFSWRSVRELAAQAFFGVRLGNITISPANIFIALALFALILVLTRAGQKALAKGPFAHSRIDPGVQNSLTTIVGYIGLVLAFVTGVSALGFNLSNLALIAGALSVGIGFGLQSIVNNFVSGLILLFERPIKVGDWVVTASGEGIVRKISVRSTEIETFDRSSIIVPNSELISSTVTNWTHKNAMGRVTVPVGVSYNSDPEQVRTILLRVAHEHEGILSFPAPFIVWNDFGASSLDFELRCFISDISKGLTIRTDLRFAIFRAFKTEGIEIPYPQQDLHVKEWPASARHEEAS